jgi:hypothetical protein
MSSKRNKASVYIVIRKKDVGKERSITRDIIVSDFFNPIFCSNLGKRYMIPVKQKKEIKIPDRNKGNPNKFETILINIGYNGKNAGAFLS